MHVAYATANDTSTYRGMLRSCKGAAARKPVWLHAWMSFQLVCARLDVLESDLNDSRANGSVAARTTLTKALRSDLSRGGVFAGYLVEPVGIGQGAAGMSRQVSRSLPYPWLVIAGTCDQLSICNNS